MRILDGRSGDVIHEIKYPKGGEGMKTLRYMSWPRDDLVMSVFPDKKGNPRKMTMVVRYEAEKVHTIAPFTLFERAVTLENDNTRVRLLSLE